MSARQAACYWPSGREIRRLSWSAAVELLDRMGADVEAIGAGGVRLSDLRDLVHRLKAESHARGDCECSAAAYIRAGGGTAPPAGAQPAPGPRCRRCKRRPALERKPWCQPCIDDLAAAGFARQGGMICPA